MEFCQEQGVDIAQLAINFSTSFKEVMPNIFHRVCYMYVMLYLRYTDYNHTRKYER